jgi:hypothetical protein
MYIQKLVRNSTTEDAIWKVFHDLPTCRFGDVRVELQSNLFHNETDVFVTVEVLDAVE